MTEQDSQFRVSPKLRNIAFILGQLPVGKQVGTWVYEKVAQRVAKEFQNIRGVHSIWLRGGMTENCRVAASDIDLTIIVESVLSTTLLLELREKYQKLACYYPMVGEVLLLTKQDWERFFLLKPSLYFCSRNQIQLPDRKVFLSVSKDSFSLRSQFAFGIQCYEIATEKLLEFLGTPLLINLAACSRNLNKLFSLSKEDLEVPNKFNLLDFSKCFANGLRLLEGMLKETDLPAAVNMLSVEEKVTLEIWKEEFLRFSKEKYPIESGDFPFLIQWTENTDHPQLEKLFHLIWRFQRSQKSQISRIPILVGTKKVNLAMGAGWVGWSKPKLPPVSQLAAYWEQVFMQGIMLPGLFVTESPKKVQTKMDFLKELLSISGYSFENQRESILEALLCLREKALRTSEAFIANRESTQ